MDINNLLRADYLDIIFEGRNKMYGGYELRRNYARRSRRASAIVAVAAAIGFAIPVIASGLGPKAIKPVEIVIEPRDLPAIPANPEVETTPPPPPPRAPEYNPPPTIAATELVVAPDAVVERPPATVDEMHNNVVSTTTTIGEGDPSLIAGPTGPGTGAGPGSDVVAYKRPDPVKFVEQMPEFPGDINAWLAAKLRYPAEANERGQEGRSIIEFVVNEDGSIEAARVGRSSFALLDAEALRVVNAMPKWKPGKQNGKAVRVLFTLPIEFKID